MAEYPEHEKLAAVKAETQAAGGFVEWLNSRGVILAAWGNAPYGDHILSPVADNLVQLLADWKDIDRNRLEQEKVAMLAEQRRLNGG